MHRPHALLLAAIVALVPAGTSRADRVLDGRMHHLRSGAEREWSEFPEQAEGKELTLRFDGTANRTEWTLRVRQKDVKQSWEVRLNDKRLGPLVVDENEQVIYLPVPAGTVRDGANELRVRAGTGGASDDVLVGGMVLVERPTNDALSECTLDVQVTDGDPGSPLPCRITIADPHSGLMSLGTRSDARLAVRPGVVYTIDGKAQVKLPAGRYTVYAGRGFEYSLASAEVELKPGDAVEQKLSIRRVVPTPGYVACDTHIHTFTWSHHGDATVEERMLTLAGEGIELPIATDHNLQIDYRPTAESMHAARYFTPIIGNEVTTPSRGHFNVFPIPAGAPLLQWQVRSWETLRKHFAQLPGDPVIILNHARDLHGGFRPFGPERHVSVTGEDVDGQSPPANAMEVINSGATRADLMDLYRDWFGMLNRGKRLTPIGASDSHDVSRYIVGQGRTYVRCDDADPGHLDMEQARRSFREGRVMVSYGLLAEIKVNEKFGPGDLVPPNSDLDVEVRVLGPEWVKASHVALYANGVKVREADIPQPAAEPEPPGVKWQARWTLGRPKHDVFLVALATGPGVTGPYWPVAKPYQPRTTEWQPYVLGSTGAVWIDADRSGRFDSAYDYASRVVNDAKGDLAATVAALADYDEAVAPQAAGILRAKSPERFEPVAMKLLPTAAPAVRRGFEAYLADWKLTRPGAKAAPSGRGE